MHILADRCLPSPGRSIVKYLLGYGKKSLATGAEVGEEVWSGGKSGLLQPSEAVATLLLLIGIAFSAP